MFDLYADKALYHNKTLLILAVFVSSHTLTMLYPRANSLLAQHEVYTKIPSVQF